MTFPIGIDKIGVYPGSLVLPLADLCTARGEDYAVLHDRLLIEERSLNPLWEDPVTMAVNAASLILSEEERASIELLIVGTESAVDQEKPLSTWVHRYLGLGPHCRNVEMKHACYASTGALQLAASWLASGVDGDAKALIISTDQSRMHVRTAHEFVLGAAACAVLVSRHPRMLEIEMGRSGYWASEVWDLARPTLNVEVGDTGLSLLTYLEALEGAFEHYRARHNGAIEFDAHFQRNIYHAPFGGIALLAHKRLAAATLGLAPAEARDHFTRKTLPSLRHLSRIGSSYGASTFIALLTLLGHDEALAPGHRIGLFAFGSGACGEFYSGIVGSRAAETARAAGLDALLDRRHRVTVDEYERLEQHRSRLVECVSYETDRLMPAFVYDRCFAGRRRLVLEGVSDYRRRYLWS